MSVVKKEVVQAAGSLQVCAGQVTVVESAIHNMIDLFESESLLQYSRLIPQTLLIALIVKYFYTISKSFVQKCPTL